MNRALRAKLEELNSGLPATAYEDAIRQIVTVSATQTLAAANREKHTLIKGGVQVTFRNAQGEHLRVFDFDHLDNNHFLCVRELWVRGDLYRRRADIVGFVNGLSLLFMELKNVGKDIRVAYEQNFLDCRTSNASITCERRQFNARKTAGALDKWRQDGGHEHGLYVHPQFKNQGMVAGGHLAHLGGLR